MTLNELFEKYPGLNNPTESGVEFFQFVEGDPNKDNLVVITSMEDFVILIYIQKQSLYRCKIWSLNHSNNRQSLFSFL